MEEERTITALHKGGETWINKDIIVKKIQDTSEWILAEIREEPDASFSTIKSIIESYTNNLINSLNF